MKYLKIYETVKFEKEKISGRSLKTYIEEQGMEYFLLHHLNYNHLYIDSLNLNSLEGIEKLYLTELYCRFNKLTSLKGIENLTNIYRIDCDHNKLKSLEELKNLVNLQTIFCYQNELTSLKGLENCKNLRELYCYQNQLKNLNEISDLQNLTSFHCYNNNFEELLPKKYNDIKFHSLYSDRDIIKFISYEFQKKFLEEHPERAKDLEQFGLDDKIIEEYKELLDFFNVRY